MVDIVEFSILQMSFHFKKSYFAEISTYSKFATNLFLKKIDTISNLLQPFLEKNWGDRNFVHLIRWKFQYIKTEKNSKETS